MTTTQVFILMLNVSYKMKNSRDGKKLAEEERDEQINGERS